MDGDATHHAHSDLASVIRALISNVCLRENITNNHLQCDIGQSDIKRSAFTALYAVCARVPINLHQIPNIIVSVLNVESKGNLYCVTRNIRKPIAILHPSVSQMK